MNEKSLSEIAQEAIQWLREKGWTQGKLSGDEQWLQCPFAGCDGSTKLDNFSININSAKWFCQRCKTGGIGLDGPSGLKAALGYSYETTFSATNTTTNQPKAEKKKESPSYLLSKEQADELLTPVTEYQDESGLFIVNKFIEERGYNKAFFLSAFDTRVGDVGVEFPPDTLKTGDTFTLKCLHLFWCLTDADGNIVHTLRRGLSADPKIAGDTMNCCGPKRIYLSKAPANPITDRIFIVEGITDAIAIAHFCQSATILGNSITDEYVESGQLDIFNGKDIIYGVDADVPDETVQKDLEILAGIANSVIRLKPKQIVSEKGKRDWNDMLVDDSEHLKEYILKGIETAKPFEAEKKEKVTVGETQKAGNNAKTEIVFPECAWRGVFDTYRQAQKGTTEAPDQYHFAVFKTVAGAIIGRSCWLWNGRHLYPNFYTVLIGPTKKSRKTTTKSRSEKLLTDTDPLVIIQRGLATSEGLIGRLQYPSTDELEGLSEIEKQRAMSVSNREGYRMVAFVNEFASLLKKAKKESSSGLIQTLTDAYDCGETLDNPTLTKPLTAKNPFVAFVGLSTREWLESNLDAGDIHGGYVNRHTFYLWTPTKPLYNPLEPDEKLSGQIKQRQIVDKSFKSL